jgi:hypothetical protein
MLLRPVPRRVRRHGPTVFGGRRMMPIIILALASWVGLIILAIEPLAMLARTVPGTARHISAHVDSKHRRSWSMRYTYVDPAGSQISQEDDITKAEAARLRPGSPLRVHVVRVGGWRYALLHRPFGQYASLRGFPWSMMVWLSFVFSMLVLVVWLKGQVRRRLVRQGTPALGKLTSKRIENVRVRNFWLKYDFLEPGPASETRTGEMVVTADQYNAVHPGDSLIIVYDPKHPGRSVIYGFSGFSAL